MTIESRLNRIERTAGMSGPCPACSGAGRPAMVRIDDAGEHWSSRGCAACGAQSSVKRIILTGQTEEAAL